MPRNILDLTITKGIGNRLELKAGIRDILNRYYTDAGCKPGRDF
jgi:hypothetical protein